MNELATDWRKFIENEKVLCISKLPEYLNKIADNLYGVVTAFKKPAKSKGGQDYNMSMTLSDPSCPPPARGFSINIFRSGPEEFPDVEVGHVVKCKVKVQSFNQRAQGLISKRNNQRLFIQILFAGDPTLTMTDSKVFTNLSGWWESLKKGESSAELVKKLVEAPKTASAKRPVLTFYDIGTDAKDKVYFDTYCRVVKLIEGKQDCTTRTVIVTDYTANSLEESSEYPMCLQSANDEDLPVGLEPEYLVVLTLWDNHAHSFDFVEGTYLYIQNVKSKKDSYGRFEYSIHGDPVYPNKRLVSMKTRLDEELSPLLRRETMVLHSRASTRPPPIDNNKEPSLPNSSNLEPKRAIPVPPAAGTAILAPLVANPSRKREYDDEFDLNDDEDFRDIDLSGMARLVANPDAKRQVLSRHGNPQSSSSDVSLVQPQKKSDSIAAVDTVTLQPPAAVVSAANSLSSSSFSTLPSPSQKSSQIPQPVPLKPSNDNFTPSIATIPTFPAPRIFKVKAKVVDYMPSIDKFVQSICPDCQHGFFQKTHQTRCKCGSAKAPTKFYYKFSLLLKDATSCLPVVVSGKEAEKLIGYPPLPAFQGGPPKSSETAVVHSLSRFFTWGKEGDSHCPKVVVKDGDDTLVNFTLASFKASSGEICVNVLEMGTL